MVVTGLGLHNPPLKEAGHKLVPKLLDHPSFRASSAGAKSGKELCKPMLPAKDQN